MQETFFPTSTVDFHPWFLSVKMQFFDSPLALFLVGNQLMLYQASDNKTSLAHYFCFLFCCFVVYSSYYLWAFSHPPRRSVTNATD